MSCGLCKGSENICLVPLEIQETYKIQKVRRALSDQEENTGKGGSPLEEERAMYDQLSQDTSEEITSAAFPDAGFF